MARDGFPSKFNFIKELNNTVPLDIFIRISLLDTNLQVEHGKVVSV